ncbi:MAG TPA: S24 family peptidase, partial [Cytophagaceae bacterium]
IELVSEKAKAGYRSGYADPDYIKELPVYQLPFLPRNRKYRTFQVSGDSMLPVKDKSWITCEYVDDWNSIRDGQPHVILTIEDGIVFKLIYKEIETNRSMLLCSTNPIYKPYHIAISEIKEVWKCKLLMSYELY